MEIIDYSLKIKYYVTKRYEADTNFGKMAQWNIDYQINRSDCLSLEFLQHMLHAIKNNSFKHDIVNITSNLLGTNQHTKNMKNKKIRWSKEELKIYILLLCANSDSRQRKKEIKVIKSKDRTELFNRIYEEFSQDDEDTSLKKIEASIAQHEYTQMELMSLRQDVTEVFLADKKLKSSERYLDRLLDNILY